MKPVGHELLGSADALVVGFPVPGEICRWAPRLQWVHHTQAGVSNLHGSDVWSSNVRLTSSRGIVAPTAIAEYAIAGAFHFARGLHEAMRQNQAGEFRRSSYRMTTLSAATIGVVGLGGIGTEVARLARALGMRVMATRRSVDQPQRDIDHADVLLPAGRLIDVAAESHFLVVCTQLTRETERFIDSTVFAAMPANGVLINVAHGEQVDEDALIEALGNGSIRGAVLDVFEGDTTGRRPRAELVEHPAVVLTPHLAGMGSNSGDEVRRLIRENVRRFVSGEPMINEVDRVHGY